MNLKSSNMKVKTNYQKAVDRLMPLILAGIVIKIDAFRGYITVGAYHPAVGNAGFCVVSYGARCPGQTQLWGGAEFTSPIARDPIAARRAAECVLDVCGTSRVLDVCRTMARKALRHRR